MATNPQRRRPPEWHEPVIPFDEDLERGIAGAAILDPNHTFSAIGSKVRQADFYRAHLGMIWNEARDIAAEGGTPSELTLHARLEARGEHAAAEAVWGLDSATPAEYITAITQWAQSLLELAERRECLARSEYDLEFSQNPRSATARSGMMRHQRRLDDIRARMQRRSDDDEHAHTDGEHLWQPGTLLSNIQDRDVEWAWENYIALGKINMGDGDPGEGKTLLYAGDLAARFTTGRNMPDGSRGLGAPVGVVIFTAEDDPEDTLGPRFDAAGGDRSRMLVVTTVPRLNEEGRPTGKDRQPSFYDLDIIRQAVKRVDAKLVIFDPFMAYLPSEAKSISDQDVRGVLAPLGRLAAELGVAILPIRHLNKGNSANVLYRGGGSIGIIGAARVGHLVARDPKDETRHILAVSKSNLGPKPPALAYTIEANANNVAVIRWQGTCDYTASDLLHVVSEYDSQSKLEQACGLLRDTLADTPMPETQVQALADARNISKATLRRAKKVLGVESKKEGIGEGSEWIWRLPQTPDAKDAHDTPKHAHTTDDEHLWTNTGDNGAQQGHSPKDAHVDGNEHLRNTIERLCPKCGGHDLKDYGDGLRCRVCDVLVGA